MSQLKQKTKNKNKRELNSEYEQYSEFNFFQMPCVQKKVNIL